jgi:hypothetical protein
LTKWGKRDKIKIKQKEKRGKREGKENAVEKSE